MSTRGFCIYFRLAAEQSFEMGYEDQAQANLDEMNKCYEDN